MLPSAALLSELVNRRVAEAMPIRLAKVSAVNEDENTVNLQFGSTVVLEVPCSSAYPIRKIDDSVIVVQIQAGNWIVIAKAVDTESPAFATAEQLEQAIDDLREDLESDLTGVFGTTPPVGAGWTQATQVWFRDVGNGKTEVAFVAAAAPSPSIPPPKKTAPKTVTLQPTAEGAWRDGGQTDDIPWQGDWTGRGDWRGGWFYGDAIEDACDGRSVKSMVLRLSRSSKANTGWGYGVPVRLGLHNQGSKGKPTMDEGPRTPFKLQPSQVRDYTLPAAWRDLLASGAMKGFCVQGDGRGNYLKFGGASGRLVISFNAS